MQSDRQQNSPSFLFFLALLTILLILSFSPILIRLSERELSAIATIADRFWIATAILLPWQFIRIFKQNNFHDILQARDFYTLNDFLLSLLAGFSKAACIVTWAWSLTQTNVANANLLHNFTPFFAVLGGWIFFKHRFKPKFLIGLAIALIGISSLGSTDINVSPATFQGDVVALLSAVFCTISFLATEKLRAKFTTTTILIWESLFKSLLMLPLVLILGDTIIPVSLVGWSAVLALGIFSSVIGPWLIFYYLKNFSVALISLFLLMEPIVAAILALVILKEPLSLVQWVVFPIVIMTIYIAQSSSVTNEL